MCECSGWAPKEHELFIYWVKNLFPGLLLFLNKAYGITNTTFYCLEIGESYTNTVWTDQPSSWSVLAGTMRKPSALTCKGKSLWNDPLCFALYFCPLEPFCVSAVTSSAWPLETLIPFYKMILESLDSKFTEVTYGAAELVQQVELQLGTFHTVSDPACC